MRLSGFLLLTPLFVAMTAPARSQRFTLEQVMSAPFSSELHAAPKGSSVVWMANIEGRRNLYLADAANPAGAARALTQYTADDGQDIGELAFTPDGQSLLYVRGGDFEFPSRPFPNAASLATASEQVIWMVALAGGAPRRLAEGRAPAVSPDGKTVAFLAKGEICTMGLGDAGTKPTPLFHARGAIGEPVWSPDGSRVAFTSGRGDHSLIGVYTLGQNRVEYQAPSTLMDRFPTWAPDSRHLAFLRVQTPFDNEAGDNRRVGPPWSILLADTTTGEARTVFSADAGPGSVFCALATEEQLFFMGAKGGAETLVFPWEKSGFEHLYAVPVAGGKPVELTPGRFEVEHVALAPGAGSLVYSGNQATTDANDTDRRHLWEVAPGDGAPKQLSSGAGIETFPVVTANGAVVTLSSDARTPTHPALVAGGRVRDLAGNLMPAGFPAAKLVVPQPLTITAADGMPLHAQLFVPAKDGNGKRHPAVVFFHGGSRRQMLLGFHYMDYYSNAYAMNEYLAALGYVVLSVNYRSGIGYGTDFREAIHYGAAGASEYNDVQGAGLYLRGRSDVDGAHIGCWGGSYGGYLTALALARSSDLFAAGADFMGVHDWNLQRGFQSAASPADAETQKLAFQSSPMASLKTWLSPVLLIQGDDDRNVRFENTVKLAAALRQQGVDVEEHVFPDEIHDFLLYRSWLTSYRLTADFFHRHLQ